MKAKSSKRCQFMPGKRDQIPEPNNSNCITPMQIDLYFLGLQVPGRYLDGKKLVSNVMQFEF